MKIKRSDKVGSSLWIKIINLPLHAKKMNRMDITINPNFQQLKPFIDNISEIFNSTGELIYTGRNQLKAYHVDGYDIIVKSFKKPHLFNRLVYTLFRPSKAKRSYEHAFELLRRGIGAPESIAFIEEKKGGLLNRSYYISIYEKGYAEIRKQMLGQDVDSDFINQLVKFIAKMHDNGVLQKDLSPGNILWKRNGEAIDFILVDINRTVYFDHPLSKEMRYRNFDRISDNQEIVNLLATEYAKVSSLDEKESLEKINKYNIEIQ
jgi:serine/threonine protein kinase